ncbi:hypothetical protein [Hymenobacter mucosus]|uniref:Uncharacterized protein n=1 Tax=Hymenobacter mucosus TaxID=1411120 RepID=A0A238ZVH6_9BACT|nr:hypothetical protein [Hymenobacter mucosus]SNR87417.1 hypothetical protein SAMN06269173_11018 [Hymenobacter mucosus]
MNYHPLLYHILIGVSLTISVLGLIAYAVMEYRDEQLQKRWRELQRLQLQQQQASYPSYVNQPSGCRSASIAKQQP